MTLRPRGSTRPMLAAFAAITLALLVPVIAFAHAVVYPKSSTTGAYERYVIRVPNEKTVATTRVELRVPADVKVNSFADVAGWQLEVVRDSAQRIVGAVWTGTLAPNRFVELPFVAVNPKSSARIAWPVIQTYADGNVVEWTGPEGSKSPASVTTIGASADSSNRGANASLWFSVGAFVLSLVSLGLALRRPAA